MGTTDAASILERLLDTTLATRDAFARAARAVKSPGFAALFVQRTEEQTRIAAYLREQLAPRVLLSVPGPEMSNGQSNRLSAGENDLYTLLGECLLALDASIVEFCRADAPTIPLAQSIQLARHQHQMVWAREEMFQLRSECMTPRFPSLERAAVG